MRAMDGSERVAQGGTQQTANANEANNARHACLTRFSETSVPSKRRKHESEPRTSQPLLHTDTRAPLPADRVCWLGFVWFVLIVHSHYDSYPRPSCYAHMASPLLASPSSLPSLPSSSSSACRRILQLTIARQSELEALPTWLDALPHAATLCAHVCLKGLTCAARSTGTTLKKLTRVRLHSCVEEPGGHENGHEGVCAYRFLLDQYDKPWEHVFFLHGDV